MKLTLDTPPLDYSDLAFLSILSDTPDYALVDDLNRLYDLDLCRVDDAAIGDLSLPLYHHSDPMCHLDYFLLHLPPAAEGFILLVRGSNCLETVHQIQRDFTEPLPEPHPADLPAVERHRMLSRYHAAFTPVSTLDITDDELADAASAGRRTLKGRAALADLLNRILAAIDIRF